MISINVDDFDVSQDAWLLRLFVHRLYSYCRLLLAPLEDCLSACLEDAVQEHSKVHEEGARDHSEKPAAH